MTYVLAFILIVVQLLGVLFLSFGLDVVFQWKGYEWLSIFVFLFLYWSLWLIDGVMRVTIGSAMSIWYLLLFFSLFSYAARVYNNLLVFSQGTSLKVTPIATRAVPSLVLSVAP